MVHALWTERQQNVSAGSHNLCMADTTATEDPVWIAVDTELKRRRKLHLAPGDWHALGRALGVAKQVVGNWKDRGTLPKARYPEVADMFGWTVDRLLGREESSNSVGDQERPTSAQSDTPTPIVTISANVAFPLAELLVQFIAAADLPGVTVVEADRWKKSMGPRMGSYSLEGAQTERPATGLVAVKSARKPAAKKDSAKADQK